ncbi:MULTISPECIES: hypothetical protein [unclassified Campylobacter]|uniref:hypothetical protein n=1 Tax=unclassified Campylobacter TaxID=2593542 RepID=UPI0022E9B9D0|nr:MULTISPECIES: hypothetical protein [unclassified Campylobacter]MDA3073312.1 hypothetical protein [Campylobacter sp. JMF_10 EL2]
MLDKNRLIFKKFVFFVIFVLVIVPFGFLFFKYFVQENEQNNEKIYERQIPINPATKDDILNTKNEIETIKKELESLSKNTKENKTIYTKIYNKELIANSVQVHFHPREFTQIGDILYVSGSNKDGFAVIDIANPDDIQPLGFFKYKHNGRIASIDLAPSSDGKFIIMADPESGIYKIDTTDFANMQIVSSYPIYTAHRVILSNDNQTAFAMSNNGLISLDIQNDIIKLDEYHAGADLNGNSYVDSENFHMKLMINLQEIANGDLQFINNYEILFMTYGGAYIFDVSNPNNIKCVKQNLQNKSSPWKMKISKDGKKAYYAEIGKFVIFDIDKFEIIQTFGDKYRFMYQEFGILENLDLFYFYVSHYDVGDEYESEALELLNSNNEVLKTYLFPQAYASHIALSDDKQRFFVGFLGGRTYYVSAVSIR